MLVGQHNQTASSVHGALQYRPARELMVALVNITKLGRYPEEMKVAGSSETSLPMTKQHDVTFHNTYKFLYVYSEVQIT